MGASAARIVRQLITEGLVLVGSGVGPALASAHFAIRLLLGLLPETAKSGMPYLQGMGLNGHVIAFAGAACVVAVVLFCLLPALRLSRAGSGPEMRDALAAGGRGFAGTMWRRFGSRLVIAELAVAMVLLVGAGLLTKSFFRLLQMDIGIEPQHLIAMRISAETARYAKDADLIALQRRVADEVAALPGVQSAGITLRLPVGGSGGSTIFQIIGRPYHGEHTEVVNREVDPGYFPTVQARLLRGRNFAASDDASSQPVMIINHAMQREYFAGEEAIGQKIAYDAKQPAKVIVGIVDDIQEGPLDEASQPVVYVPVAQETWGRFYAVVRTAVPEQEMAGGLGAAVAKIDPTLTLFPPESMTQRIRDTPAAYLHRSSAWIAGSFAVIAMLLGVVGIYGVIAYSVSQRTREIGVRIALGARRAAVYRLVLWDAAWLTALGIGCGAAGSAIAATLMRKLLFHVAPYDAVTFLAVSAALAALALMASFIPAHRAASVEPMQALRSE
jgi:predicted permease